GRRLIWAKQCPGPAQAGQQKTRRGAPSARTERVVADAMAFEPLADAPPASFPIHNVKQPSFFLPGLFLRPGSSSFSPSSLPTPERGDWRSAQRRPALIRVAQ